MNIQSTTVKAYTLTITHDEAIAAIADPTLITSRLKAAVHGAFDGDESSVDISPKNFRGGVRKGGSPKGKTGKGKFAKIPCPICSKPIAESKMQYHVDHKHPAVSDQVSAALDAKSS